MADHWVPQCYLRNFSISGDNEKVYLYERGKFPIPTGINNVAAENNRYTFINKETGKKSRDVEKMLCILEGAAAPALKKIAQEKKLENLDASEYGALLQFIAFLATRGPTFENISKNLYKEIFKRFMEIRAQNPKILLEEFKKIGITFKSSEEFEKMRKSLLDLDNLNFEITGGKGKFFKHAAETAVKLTDIFYKEKGLFLLVSNNERVFITSDNPVVLQIPPDIPWWLAGGYKYGTVIVTISPQVCLVLRSRPLKQEVIYINATQVDGINNSIMKSARRQVYSNLSSKSIKQRYDLCSVGEDSKVTSTKMKSSPYVFTKGPSADKELAFIDRYSMSWEEMEDEIKKTKIRKPI